MQKIKTLNLEPASQKQIAETYELASIAIDASDAVLQTEAHRSIRVVGADPEGGYYTGYTHFLLADINYQRNFVGLKGLVEIATSNEFLLECDQSKFAESVERRHTSQSFYIYEQTGGLAIRLARRVSTLEEDKDLFERAEVLLEEDDVAYSGYADVSSLELAQLNRAIRAHLPQINSAVKLQGATDRASVEELERLFLQS